MSGTLIRTALRNSLAQVRHVTPVRPAAASGVVAEVYRQVERDLGMLAPQIALHSAAPGPLAASWLMLRETLVAAGTVDRTAKEAVAAIISLGNGCRYCAELHTGTLDALAEARDQDGHADPGYDHGVRAVADWARTTLRRATTPHRRMPLPVRQLPELIGVTVTTHYLNRMVNVFLPGSPLPGVPTAARVRALGRLGRFLLPSATARHAAGGSLDLWPVAPLPRDLAWAAANPAIASAFARAAAAIDSAAEYFVPDRVCETLRRALSEWDGTPPDADRRWVGEAVSGLPFAERPVARLVLLTAMSSDQVDPSLIEDVRRTGPGDRALVELTSWASLTAARQLGRWAAEAAGHLAEPVRVLAAAGR